jgi:hypothetical protein
VVILVTGVAIGFIGLPFVGATVGLRDLPLAASEALCLSGLLPAAAATWVLVRDVPIRPKTV